MIYNIHLLHSLFYRVGLLSDNLPNIVQQILIDLWIHL